MQTERGAASILIQLRDGGVKVIHGTDGTVLHYFDAVPEGTWSKVFDAVIRELMRAEIDKLQESR